MSDIEGPIFSFALLAELREVMATASQEVVGEPLATSQNGIGLDSFADDPPDRVQDFIEWRDRPRCEGYLARLAVHEGLLGV